MRREAERRSICRRGALMCTRSFIATARNAVRLDPSLVWGRAPRPIAFLMAAVFFAAGGAQGAEPFDQVQKILNASCINCHGGEKAQPGLRLDTRQGIARVVVAGKSAESLIIQRVTTADVLRRMPLGGPPLKPEVIAVLAAWIDAGAVLPKALAVSE